MNKTIKRVKEMRLDELIRYVWDNGIEDTYVKSKTGDKRVIFEQYKLFLEEGINKEDVFEITVEETITEDTEFKMMIEIFGKSDAVCHYDMSVRNVKDSITERIYALIDGELVKIWQRGEENV